MGSQGSFTKRSYMTFSSQHHSFDILIATRYGVEKAILIHHFQHWIRLNRFKKINLYEGKCWSFQTREYIAGNFSYMSFDTVRRHMEQLVELGVLEQNNFNKNPMSRTLWYAFKDEKLWGVDDDSVQSFYFNINSHRELKESLRKADLPNAKADLPNAKGKIAKCNIGKDTRIEDAKRKKIKKEAPPPSAIAQDLSEKFLQKLKRLKPDFVPRSTQKWPQEFDQMIDKENRDPQKIEQVIESMTPQQMVYIQSAEKLRKQFDALELKNQTQIEKINKDQNRLFFLKYQNELKKDFKGFSFNEYDVIDTKSNKRIPLSLPHRQFVEAIAELIGGEVSE